MNKLLFITASTLTGVTMATALAAPVYAWHPEGKIIKTVQNVTAGTPASDANTAASAVAAKPGDTLRYTVTVSNTAAPAAKQYNDLAFTVMKDTLPTGVALIAAPNQRQITEDLGTIVPGKSVTKTYDVKVVASTDGVIVNKACFTGNSVVKDAPRQGCDTANIKVTVPITPVTPVTSVPATPTPTPAPAVVESAAVEKPQTLPQTGAAGLFAFGGLAVAAGYGANLLRLRRFQ